MKTVQYFDNDYLDYCKKLSVHQRLQFLEDFRKLHGSKSPSKSRLISLRVPEDLLELFKKKADAQGKKYQAKIKELMAEWCGKEI